MGGKPWTFELVLHPQVEVVSVRGVNQERRDDQEEKRAEAYALCAGAMVNLRPGRLAKGFPAGRSEARGREVEQLDPPGRVSCPGPVSRGLGLSGTIFPKSSFCQLSFALLKERALCDATVGPA